MHFPLFQIPPIFEKFSDFLKNFKNLTFSRKISHFHPPKFLTFFSESSTKNFGFPPYFACFSTFPSLIRKNLLFPPTFQNFPLFSKNSTAFYILYVYFPPYFHHDAFMHHPMHVLDASENDDGSLPDGRFIGFYATR